MSEAGEIRNTLYRLAWGGDQRDLQCLRDGYTADARWVRQVTEDQVETVDGLEAILARSQEVWSKNPGAKNRHVISNVFIQRETEDEAEVTSYKTMIRNVDGKAVIASTGWYRDLMVKQAGAWKVKDRYITQD